MSKNRMKVQKTLPHFVEEVSALTVEQLNGRLAKLAKDYTATEEAKDADEELQNTREAAKELGAPYREAKRDINLKSGYIVELIREKGGE